MANFIGGNLLAGVQKKIFPNGVAVDVSERLDRMAMFQNAGLNNTDAFSGKNSVASKAFTMYRAYDFSNVKELKQACEAEGLRVKIDSVETKYVADAEQTGSVSVYTFTDRRGNKVQINNINAQEYLNQEKEAFDDLLQGVIDEVVAGKIDIQSHMPAEEQTAA